MIAAYIGNGWTSPTFIAPRDDVEANMPVVLVVSDGTRPDPRRLQADLVEAWRVAGRPVTVAVCVFGTPAETVRTVRRWVGLHEFAGIGFRAVSTRPANVEQALVYGARLQHPAAGWVEAA